MPRCSGLIEPAQVGELHLPACLAARAEPPGGGPTEIIQIFRCGFPQDNGSRWFEPSLQTTGSNKSPVLLSATQQQWARRVPVAALAVDRGCRRCREGASARPAQESRQAQVASTDDVT